MNTNTCFSFIQNLSSMKRHFVVALFFLFGVFQSLGQVAGDAGNFDIRGNVYSGTPTSGADDWFQGLTGTGFGLIDETQTASFLAITESLSNTPFNVGSSHNQYEVVNGSIQYQSIYARDYVNFNSLESGNVDRTTFVGGNKNGDSPQDTWGIIPSPVLSKNHLVDNYIHLRRA